jgi:hypothetical protein
MRKKTVSNKSLYRRKKNKINRKNTSRKMKGGNFGGNCSDPNFSIYNTNMLKLFPYSTFAKG